LAQPDHTVLREAAAVLRGGGLVAFPTETVYGLGANALDADAAARIFHAKGRPGTNPVIVHVHEVGAVTPLVRQVPGLALRLAERFWPGPLSLVLPRSERVPDVVTASGPTVAVRVPAHPVALALLREVGLPLAAPSANRSTCLSPTRAEHVLRGLDGRIDLVLDAGPTSGGLESTVLDITTTPPRLLRPGLVSPADLEALVGPIERRHSGAEGGPVRSPGLLERHYAPGTPLLCVYRQDLEDAATRYGRVGVLAFDENIALERAVVELMPPDAASYAVRLYETLHRMDEAKVDHILVELPPEGDEWLAIHDRLRRAQQR
jgi:L-threonylcarbamoyladenylate synthase